MSPQRGRWVHVHRRTFLTTALALPLAACTPPRVEVVVSGEPPEPTFTCADSDKPGSVPEQFTGLTVWRWDEIHSFSDMPSAVVWGLESDHLLGGVVYGHAPQNTREFHPPSPLVERTIYLVRVSNTHNDRSGQRHFGFTGKHLMVARDAAPDELPAVLADLARRLANA